MHQTCFVYWCVCVLTKAKWSSWPPLADSFCLPGKSGLFLMPLWRLSAALAQRRGGLVHLTSHFIDLVKTSRSTPVGDSSQTGDTQTGKLHIPHFDIQNCCKQPTVRGPAPLLFILWYQVCVGQQRHGLNASQNCIYFVKHYPTTTLSKKTKQLLS